MAPANKGGRVNAIGVQFQVVGLPERSPIFHTRSEAERWLADRLEHTPERQVRIRPCLRCRRSFASEGPHNRMCNPCRGLGEAYAGVASLATAKVRRAAQI